jgi:hypothetical protein
VLTAFLQSNLHLRSSNDWASKTCTKQVAALVLCIALNGAEAQLLDKLAAEILNHHLGCSQLLCLCADLTPIFLLRGQLVGMLSRVLVRLTHLSNVCKEANDFISLFKKPFQDTRGIETTRVGKTHFSSACHF